MSSIILFFFVSSENTTLCFTLCILDLKSVYWVVYTGSGFMSSPPKIIYKTICRNILKVALCYAVYGNFLRGMKNKSPAARVSLRNLRFVNIENKNFRRCNDVSVTLYVKMRFYVNI